MQNKTDNIYLRYPIAIWALIFIAVILTVNFTSSKVKSIEKEYWDSAEGKYSGDYELYKKLEGAKDANIKTRSTLFQILGAWTIITFILQIAGFRQAKHKKIYRWTRIVFGGLTLAFIILAFFMAIVPTGPIR